MTPIIRDLDERNRQVKNIIKQSNKNMNISCRGLNKKHVNRILKKRLNYHFIKTTIKTDKLLQNESKRQTFFF